MYINPFEALYTEMIETEVDLMNTTVHRKFRLCCKDSDGNWNFFKKMPILYVATIKKQEEDLIGIVVEKEIILSERELFGMVLTGEVKEVKD
jgi:hypothetical protein